MAGRGSPLFQFLILSPVSPQNPFNLFQLKNEPEKRSSDKTPGSESFLAKRLELEFFDFLLSKLRSRQDSLPGDLERNRDSLWYTPYLEDEYRSLFQKTAPPKEEEKLSAIFETVILYEAKRGSIAELYPEKTDEWKKNNSSGPIFSF